MAKNRVRVYRETCKVTSEITMKGTHIKGVKFAVTTLTLAIAVLAGPRVFAQDGACCSQLETEVRNCRTAGCNGQITVRGCADPNGTNARLYKIVEVRCCTLQYSSFTVPTSACPDSVSDLASTSLTPLEKDLCAQGGWVLTCARKYVFFVRPATS